MTFVKEETLRISNLSELKLGDEINIERCMQLGGRLDGHIVQGHVDTTARCIDIKEEGGSWKFRFKHKKTEHFTVEKGSICVNGVSLTISKINDIELFFEVCIVPHTYVETIFQYIQLNEDVNLEFDMIAKQINRTTSLLKL